MRDGCRGTALDLLIPTTLAASEPIVAVPDRLLDLRGHVRYLLA